MHSEATKQAIRDGVNRRYAGLGTTNGKYAIRNLICVCGTPFKTRCATKEFCSTPCRRSHTTVKRKQDNVSRVIKWRRELKKRAVEYKGGKCQACGYSRCLEALDFHHRNSDEKEFAFARSVHSWSSVQAELDKCDLLCSNCHREEHVRLRALGSKTDDL